MPRIRRQISESGYYHVMVRGNARQIIFESDGGRKFFLDCLENSLEGTSASILAWCLMDNHVHLLFSDPDGQLSAIMHRILTKYARFFNSLGDRVGHVFQDRFKSIPIESDSYLLEAVRYIHRNPVKEGLCDMPGDYRWSSYGDYLSGFGFTDTGTILSMLGGRERFVEFNNNEADYMPGFSNRLSQEDALAVARSLVGFDDLHIIGTFSVKVRNGFLAKLREGGFSIREIERMTGIGRGIVQEAVPSAKHNS